MRYDAIVIGSGAGGGIAACVLAEGGKRVLLLERGRLLEWEDETRDHLRNHRLSQYGHNTGPELKGNPRVFVEDGKETVVQPNDGRWSNIASAVGSGTLVYGGQAWRYHPLDFRMASTYGVPEGSSLVDWPFGYDELAPYYEMAEWEIGVSGGPPAPEMPARREYPMPRGRTTEKGRRLAAGAERLGWDTQAPPLLINMVPRNGRGACAECQHCVGFQCPTNAKNGTQNTVIPRASATGRCELITEASVTKIVHEQGEATGVTYVWHGHEIRAEADVIVVAGGAIETARLLMISGLGNDHVGRNLQGHYYAVAWGLMPDPVWDGVGPGASISTLKFNHGNDGIVGGGMLADDFVTLPIVYAKWFRPENVPAWGLEHKRWMRDTYRRFIQVMGPVHEIPSPECRVTLDPVVTDKLGLPAARLGGTTHPETLRTTSYMTDRAKEWLVGAGAEVVYSRQPELRLSAGQHQAGTCRMGEDPALSAVDTNGRVHGTKNVYVADGSAHPTNGGFNPVLTIMAMSFRTSNNLLRNW
ncbi:GMC family oxidoreductase [Fimbriimonas ginsengisoli]|uniref:Glucose-methanol-choline oxidoreductase n=1 Tax=Fimbriimonas ginsengisoli Gsoil 348 TaxID=661478 RepID=A0A068NSE9_FIMGI|nr:GMC family oxidoreductase [Fimbriimonas ginsengisoli]AIE85685.1 glucose-methanol-choline oxidoreductase [Fimbriimonas ginsengisoli Gsoil 348]